MSAPLLAVDGLGVTFATEDGPLKAVEDLSFAVARGKTLGIVGESGCGKSVTALAIMGLLPKKGARATGRVSFEGRPILGLDDAALNRLRGDRLAMIFQEPMSSLNPAHRIGDQIAETVMRHRGLAREAAWARAVDMLARVRIPDPARRARDYPHRLSGGMRQRAMIAMALACDPALLIADEPTTALDVTVQAQVLDLMRALRRESGAAIILITHDLGVVAEMADEVLVMYAGQAVERAPVADIFARPQHPYTVGLLGSIPRFGARRRHLAAIEGMVPGLAAMPKACRFAPRCPFAEERCRAEAPPLAPPKGGGAGRLARCWKTPLESLAA
jgi:peptide/nickel transport system ATP-binding protein